MENLIKALQIFLKYKNESYPTNCCHDVLCIMGVTEEEVSTTDKETLDKLGFFWSEEYDCFASFKYGSA